MYKSFFAFRRYPFGEALQVDELFASQSQQEAAARIRHLVELRGIGILTGEAGSGKTTVCRQETSALNPGLYRVSYVTLSTGSVLDLYNTIAASLKLPVMMTRATANRAIQEEITP